MESQENEDNLVKQASDARERRKLQNRLAQRNFRRRQNLKETQQQQQRRQAHLSQEPDLPPISTTTASRTDGLGHHSPLLPDDTLREVRAAPLPQETARTTTGQINPDEESAGYPLIPPLPGTGSHSENMNYAAPTGPISVSFPLFRSADELWIDRPGDGARVGFGGSESYQAACSNDITATALLSPLSASPFTTHPSPETMKTLASPDHRALPVPSKKARQQPPEPPRPDRSQSTTFTRPLPVGAPLLTLLDPPSMSFNSDPQPPDTWEGKMTLHICAEKGDANVLRFLLSYGAEIDATDSLGRTALHYAALRGYVDSVCVLLERGADTECTDESGLTPLHVAAQNGHEAVVRMLVCEGADLNARIRARAFSQP